MTVLRQFAPRYLLRSEHWDQFGTPVLTPTGQGRLPGRFGVRAWHIPPGFGEAHLRAAIVQNYLAGAINLAFDTALPDADRGGIGSGTGSRSKFADRVGINRKRLSRVLCGRSALDAIDLGHLLSLPPPAYPEVTLARAASEVAQVLRARWERSGRRSGAPDPVLWPVAGYGTRDRSGRRRPDAGGMNSSDDSPDSVAMCGPMSDADEQRWDYIAGLIDGPLSACLQDLWREAARVNSWTAAGPPETELNMIVMRRFDPPRRLGLLVELADDDIGGTVILAWDWPTKVGRNALIDGTFVIDVLDRDEWGQPSSVVAVRKMRTRADGEEVTISSGRARVVRLDGRARLVDWVEPEQWMGSRA